MSCAECGFAIAEGTAGCQRAFDELVARDFSNALYGRWHRLLVDVYALQHAERYCASAKSLAAHLGGLCCALERGGDAETYRALQRSLNGAKTFAKPAVPRARGELTIASVLPVTDPRAYGRGAGTLGASHLAGVCAAALPGAGVPEGLKVPGT